MRPVIFQVMRADDGAHYSIVERSENGINFVEVIADEAYAPARVCVGRPWCNIVVDPEDALCAFHRMLPRRRYVLTGHYANRAFSEGFDSREKRRPALSPSFVDVSAPDRERSDDAAGDAWIVHSQRERIAGSAR